MIRRRGQTQHDSESSSDEEDAFSALSRKSTSKRTKTTGSTICSSTSASVSVKLSTEEENDAVTKSSATLQPPESAFVLGSVSVLPQSVTSSMKRHHKPNDTRKAKMDALLEELEAEKNRSSTSGKSDESHRFIPEKKGSFVDPSEEHVTTNIFVGGLAPSITEEDLSGLFSQFGDLYSIKIMWPRTMEERQRGRNTGFVCFMRRDDAEEAMDACNETDPFNVGRLLMMRWGKNVKKNVRRGTGGLADTSNRPNDNPRPNAQEENGEERHNSTAVAGCTSKAAPLVANGASIECGSQVRDDGFPEGFMLADAEMQEETQCKPYDAALHATAAIRIESPPDKSRFHFISRVAFYVAKDGVDLEKRLFEEEGKNPLFNFLSLENATEEQRNDNLFYRWRVFSFSQGDTYSIWRTEPFAMFHPSGRYWIPPPLDAEAAALEREASGGAESRPNQRNEDRHKREYRSGRHFQVARSIRRKGRGQVGENSSRLSEEEVLQFEALVRKELTTSREAICRAMAFCFDKCLAAKEVSNLLREALLDDSHVVTIDMKIARLYLLSDVLFNSQQPGVRNAFMYRSTIESMAPEIFSSLGKHRDMNIGRITINKLRKAVSAVLGAWTEWGVYNPVFLDELEAHFEGREVIAEAAAGDSFGGSQKAGAHDEESEELESLDDVVVSGPRGDWTEVLASEIDPDGEETVINPCLDDSDEVRGLKKNDKPGINEAKFDHTKQRSTYKEISVNENAINGRNDGENDDSAEGEPIVDDKIDGEPLGNTDGCNVDGEDLDDAVERRNLDEESLDGEDLDGEDLDGEEMDEEALDGESFDDAES